MTRSERRAAVHEPIRLGTGLNGEQVVCVVAAESRRRTALDDVEDVGAEHFEGRHAPESSASTLSAAGCATAAA